MNIGKVVDTILSTRKHEGLQGVKLLLVETSPGGETIAAGDILGAGVGEYVLVTRGTQAAAALGRPAPVDAMVTGILDQPPVWEKQK